MVKSEVIISTWFIKINRNPQLWQSDRQFNFFFFVEFDSKQCRALLRVYAQSRRFIFTITDFPLKTLSKAIFILLLRFIAESGSQRNLRIHHRIRRFRNFIPKIIIGKNSNNLPDTDRNIVVERIKIKPIDNFPPFSTSAYRKSPIRLSLRLAEVDRYTVPQGLKPNCRIQGKRQIPGKVPKHKHKQTYFIFTHHM